MRKIFALKNGIYFSVETDGDETRFYAHRKGTPYGDRKEVTPRELPNKVILNEIFSTRMYSDPASAALKQLTNRLYKAYKGEKAV